MENSVKHLRCPTHGEIAKINSNSRKLKDLNSLQMQSDIEEIYDKDEQENARAP